MRHIDSDNKNQVNAINTFRHNMSLANDISIDEGVGRHRLCEISGRPVPCGNSRPIVDKNKPPMALSAAQRIVIRDTVGTPDRVTRPSSLKDLLTPQSSVRLRNSRLNQSLNSSRPRNDSIKNSLPREEVTTTTLLPNR